MKRLFIYLLLLIVWVLNGWGMDVEEFNNELSHLVRLVYDGNVTGSEKFLKNLANAAQTCDFGVVEKKEANHNYTSPYLSDLPAALKYKTLQKADEKIRDLYHETLQKIDEVENNIAVKKYFTALKILITGFSTYKTAIDLIKTDYSLKELIELPSNLSQTVEQYKKDAENIKNKFDSIKSEKEKLEYLNNFKKKLIDLVHKIRSVKNFLLTHRYYLTKLDKSIQFCNDSIRHINNEVFIPKPEPNQQSADVTRYDDELNKAKADLLNKHISLREYLGIRNRILESVADICKKVGDCIIGKAVESAMKKCYTRDPSIAECLVLDELDPENAYYDTELKLKDGSKVVPTYYDFNVLTKYVRNLNQYFAHKISFLNAFTSLVQKIENTDFLMRDGNYTARPITLEPVEVKDELYPLAYGKTPRGCNPYYYDDNFSAVYVGPSHNGSGGLEYMEVTPSKGPEVFDQYYIDSFRENAHLNYIKQPPIWYEAMNYTDKVQEEVNKIFNIAYTGYADIPRCNMDTSCIYAVALFDEDKMRDLEYNIRLLADDLAQYKEDLRELSQDLDDISNEAKKLLDLYSQILIYQSFIYLKDIDFTIPIDSFTFHIFLGVEDNTYTEIGFVESYPLLDCIASMKDSFESRRWEMNDHIDKTRDSIYRDEMGLIDDTFSFNEKLKDKKDDINKTNSFLRQNGSYKSLLDSLYDTMTIVLWDIKRGKISYVYDDAKRMQKSYESIVKLPLSDIAEKITKIDEYFKKIKDASNRYDAVFQGDNLIFRDNKYIVNMMKSVYWPSCNRTYLAHDVVKKYFNYYQIANKLPKVKAFIDRYTSDTYKPKPVPTKFVLKEAYMSPTAINGPGKVEFTLQFENVNHTRWGTCYFDLVTVMEDEDYEFESVKGYNPIYYNWYGNEHHDHYYTIPDKNGIVKFALDIKDDKFGDVPLKSIYVHAYMTSSTIPSWKFDGDEANAVMFEIHNLKYDTESDKNGNNIVDSWEERYHIDNINADADGDGLSNKEELLYGSDPFVADSDGDGIDDAKEVQYGLDPRFDDAQKDIDNDGITNKEEILHGFDPTDPNSPKKKIYGVVTNKNGAKFDLEIYASIDTNVSGLLIDFDFPDGFTLVNAQSSCCSVDTEGKSIHIGSLVKVEGALYIATLTFENESLLQDFNFSCKSNNDAVFCAPLNYIFSFARFTYDLQSGWNLIDNPYSVKLPLNLFDVCDIVWQYDKGWKAYSTKYEKLLQENNITLSNTLPAKNGAWVYCGSEQTLQTKNVSLQHSLFDTLDRGWNLVGIKVPVNAQDMFVMYPGTSIIWSWRDGVWSYAVNKDDFNSTLQDIQEHSAVWIKKE